MRIDYRVFDAVKRGNAPDEYEDAYWPRDPISVAMPTFRCAIADGATETSFAGAWARALVRSWCRGQLSGGHGTRYLAKLQARWRAEVMKLPLPWYAEEKARSGAFSSLLGLTLFGAERHEWRAAAVGDSCLFQVRGGELITSFPYASSLEFNNRPALLGSRASPEAQRSLWLTSGGSLEWGDTFLLMTDAAACWFLSRLESGDSPAIVERLLGESRCDGKAALDELRANRLMRNDDVTIVRLTVMET